jgi:hypothetical protein
LAKEVPTGRLRRAMKLGGMAAGLAGDAAAAVTAIGKQAGAEFHRRAAERLLARLGEMKGLPMKLGQMLSYVDDMVPPEHRAQYRDTLGSLRIRARPMKLDTSSIEQRFARFDTEPIAAASIGQVYRAELRDGTPVAVKIQYPGIKEAIESDLSNVDTLISALSVVLPKVELEGTIADITARVGEECDYGSELRHQQDFERIYGGDPEIFVPHAHPELSSERVLVTDLVTGIGWEEMLRTASPEAKKRYGAIIFRFVFETLYRHGMFNADPHPGNYIFMPDGRIAFLDFGCVQRFPPDALAAFVAVRQQVVAGVRGEELYRTLSTAYGIPDGMDADVRRLIEDFVLISFAPLIRPQPFRYDRAFTEELTRLTMHAKLELSKKLFRMGIRETKRPGLVFLNRINFGLNSILSALEAEADWVAILERIDQKAEHPSRSRSRGSTFSS